MEERIAKILMTDRITPHSTTGVAPAELILGRQLISRLDLLRPNLAERVEQKQLKQKISHDTKAKTRTLEIGDSVLVRNYAGRGKAGNGSMG